MGGCPDGGQRHRNLPTWERNATLYASLESNRSTSWVPSGPPRSNDAFLRSVVAGATIPSIICSSVLPECMVVGEFLPLYVSFTSQHNLKGFVSVSTPLISKMRTFPKKSASVVVIIPQFCVQPRRQFFEKCSRLRKKGGVLMLLKTTLHL